MKLKDSIPPIHSEGYLFILIAAAISLLIGAIVTWLGFICLFITIFIICFFRDPNRVTPKGESKVVSPADGVVHQIEDAVAPEELGLGKKPLKRISVFLSVFNVHVNRVPTSGKITKLNYRSGKFLNAAAEKASSDNERQSCVVTREDGVEIVFVQIAGLIAKRIICDLEEGQEVQAGEKFGIIRFGSRMDIYMPKNAEINVTVGQTMIGGETVLADVAMLKKSIEKETVKKEVKKNIVKKSVLKK